MLKCALLQWYEPSVMSVPMYSYSSPAWLHNSVQSLLNSLLMLQFMLIETTGKKILLFRGYMAMSVTLVLLTITLYLQVSHHTQHQLLLKEYFCTFWYLKHVTSWETATQATHKLTHIFCVPQGHISWMPYCSMVLIFFFIIFFASGPGMLIPDITTLQILLDISI